LTTIGANAFMRWNSANMSSNLVIPANVTSIETEAFREWLVNTKGVTFMRSTPPTFGGNVFTGWNYWTSGGRTGIPITVQPLVGNTTPSAYSAWKVALTGNGTFSTINGISWASIP
jgi:hypothetical protein